jgi:hypothetical protein
MELILLVLTIAFVAFSFQRRDERRRIALLGSHLGQYQIEKLMATLTEGYMRALGEADPARQAQIWSTLTTAESALCEQFNRLVAAFARVDTADARVSKLALSIFYTQKLMPDATFDLRKVLSVHARGICNAANNAQGRNPKDKAFTVLAELFLMQHTCHWFCKSKLVASSRLLVRHQTPYAKVLESVAPETRQAYSALVAR